MAPITPRELDILAFLSAFIAQKGYPPTAKEIGACFGIRSTNAVHEHLVSLKEKGCISWEPRRCRTLCVLKPAPTGVR